jgi:hypothetical protein
MKKLAILSVVATFALGACGNDAAKELETWKEAACACQDKGCAEKQAKAFWKIAEKFKDKDKPSEAEAKRLDELADSGQECLEKLEVDIYDMAG